MRAIVTAPHAKREPSFSAVLSWPRARRPIQYNTVLMKISTLIHRIALWLDRKYFNRNTLSAFDRSAPNPSRCCWYSAMATSAAAATPMVSPRRRPQNQPSATRAGSTPAKMGFS